MSINRMTEGYDVNIRTEFESAKEKWINGNNGYYFFVSLFAMTGEYAIDKNTEKQIP